MRAPKIACASPSPAEPRATPRANAAPAGLVAPALRPPCGRECCATAGRAYNSPVMNVANSTRRPSLDDRPFAVRSGQHRQDASVVVANRADELRLLAAHDIGNAGGADAARTGHDGELAAGRRRERAPEPREIRRAFDVRRLDPALPAADHSAGDPRCRIVAPIVEQRVERRRRTGRRAATRCRAARCASRRSRRRESRRYARADVVPQSMAIKAVLRDSVTARDGSRPRGRGQARQRLQLRTARAVALSKRAGFSRPRFRRPDLPTRRRVVVARARLDPARAAGVSSFFQNGARVLR